MEAQRKPEAKAEGKGEPGEASAEIDAGGRRKEIADETCMKLCEWKPQGGNHRFMMVGKQVHSSLDRKAGAFLFYNAQGATRPGGSFLFDGKLEQDFSFEVRRVWCPGGIPWEKRPGFSGRPERNN